MNLLDKYNSLSETLKQEIRIFIDNPSDIFLSPSGNKLIFQHAFESFERFEYKIFHQAVTNAGFSDDEWVLVDSNFKEDYKNILHIDFQIHRTREHLINSKNIKVQGDNGSYTVAPSLLVKKTFTTEVYS